MSGQCRRPGCERAWAQGDQDVMLRGLSLTPQAVQTPTGRLTLRGQNGQLSGGGGQPGTQMAEQQAEAGRASHHRDPGGSSI